MLQKIEGLVSKSRRYKTIGRLPYFISIRDCIIHSLAGLFCPPESPKRNWTSIGKVLTSSEGLGETLIRDQNVAEAGFSDTNSKVLFSFIQFLKARPLYFYTTNFSLVFSQERSQNFKSIHTPPKTPEFGRKCFVLI